jgi:hypothetical protein
VKTSTDIAHETIAANYAPEDPDDGSNADALQDLLDSSALSADDIRTLITASIDADREQRRHPIITVPTAGLRFRALDPSDAYTAILDLLETGYSLDQIEWEN